MNKEILTYIPRMIVGEELMEAMQVLPPYDESIRLENHPLRLMALNDIFDLYVSNEMSVEIYSKLYLAMIKSLEKKFSKMAIKQRNENFKTIKGGEGNGIIGGSDSFTIIGDSGIGKSSTIQRAISLLTFNKVIEIEEPFMRIAPCIVVQCPFDCSIKGMLLEILRQIDEMIGSVYYEKMVRARATTDMLIGSVSQVALNHLGLLIVDEIQNVANHRNGTQLIGALTQLINNSSISICMVGTPKVEQFFESVNYLARRTLGLRYTNLEYDIYFKHFCEIAFSYQYVKNPTQITNGIMEWLYQHSGGALANVITLLHDAQEMAILSGKEELNIESLNMAYQQRMSMLHHHIQPCIKKNTKSSHKKQHSLPEGNETLNDFINEGSEMDLVSSIKEAKENKIDVVKHLMKWIPIEEVAI